MLWAWGATALTDLASIFGWAGCDLSGLLAAIALGLVAWKPTKMFRTRRNFQFAVRHRHVVFLATQNSVESSAAAMTGAVFLPVIFSAVRGTFAYHRYRAAKIVKSRHNSMRAGSKFLSTL